MLKKSSDRNEKANTSSSRLARYFEEFNKKDALLLFEEKRLYFS